MALYLDEKPNLDGALLLTYAGYRGNEGSYSLRVNVPANPTHDFLNSIVNDHERPVVCIGGGSVIDAGKWHEATEVTPDLSAVPATCGTGAECTNFVTIYEGGVKRSVPALRPDNVYIHPDYVSTASRYVKACSVIDCLCHIMESYWSNQKTEESHRYSSVAENLALGSAALVLKWNHSPDMESMMLAAHYAGKAINISKTTLLHALSYHLTSKGVPHGHALSIYARGVAKYNGLEGVFKPELDIIDEIKPQTLPLWLNADNIIGDINQERAQNNPKELDVEELKACILSSLPALSARAQHYSVA